MSTKSKAHSKSPAKKKSKSTNTALDARSLQRLERDVKRAARDPVLLEQVISNSRRTGFYPNPEFACDKDETLFGFVSSIYEYVAEGRKNQGREFDEKTCKQRIWNFANDPASGITVDEFAEEFFNYCRLDRGGFGDLKLLSPGIPAMFERLHQGGKGKMRFTAHLWTDIPSFKSTHPITEQWNESDAARVQTYNLIKKTGLKIAHDNIEFYSPDQKVKHMQLVLVDDKRSTAIKVEERGRVCFVPRNETNGGVKLARVVYLDSIDQLEFALRTFFDELYLALKENENKTGTLQVPPFVDWFRSQ